MIQEGGPGRRPTLIIPAVLKHGEDRFAQTGGADCLLEGRCFVEALFGGDQSGLWVTNGTAAGTHELTGIKGADPSGLSPSDFTVFNNEVLFEGFDSSGERSLWVTNGTVAGTHEITGISGAFTGTIGPYNQPGGLNPNAPTTVSLTDPANSQLVGAFVVSLLLGALQWRRGETVKVLEIGSLALFGALSTRLSPRPSGRLPLYGSPSMPACSPSRLSLCSSGSPSRCNMRARACRRNSGRRRFF